MTEFRAKPQGLVWVLQEKRFGIWRTCHRSYNGGEVSDPMTFFTLEAAKAEADRLRLQDASRAETARRIADHEQEEPVTL